jgi:hypothetical protein
LSVEVTEYASFDSQLELCDKVRESNIRARLWNFRDRMLAKNDAPAFLTANAYIKYEEYLRAGSSELQAGRMVATTYFARERRPRKNASRNPTTMKYWYRRRARAIMKGYRYFYCTNTLLPETRGRCRGKSHIHDPVVQQLCRVIIHRLGKTWSARTFRFHLYISQLLSDTILIDIYLVIALVDLEIRSRRNYKITDSLRKEGK